MPSTSFQPILDAALADYSIQVGIDIATHPFTDSLRSCSSPNDVLKLLEDKANKFKDFRDGNRSLLNWLSPVVQVVHTLSGVLGASMAFVRQTIFPFTFSLIILPGSVRTSKGYFCWCGYSHHSRHPSHSPVASLMISVSYRRPVELAPATMRSLTCLNVLEISSNAFVSIMIFP